MESTRDLLAVAAPGVASEQEEAPMLLDRASAPEPHAAVTGEWWLHRDGLGRTRVRRAVHDEAHRTLRPVLAEQHDGAEEVRITELRHGDQQRRGQRRPILVHAPMLPALRRLVNGWCEECANLPGEGIRTLPHRQVPTSRKADEARARDAASRTSPFGNGTSGSATPWITSVGAVMSPSARAAIAL
jgi:hypothetical protein